ncbi:NAD(P)-dependent oxidoreductase [Wenyingzhuangia fucanilytica]|uniref:dTDP-4-dehydrorhamnose reductase n=1 Tax=Wenyingzhuangia fucanilytica TaxID=1790137 RepID=A0A1B1Y7T4_9FLAO|nr:dTDP-4-dehydrorhamnose reductase [Wenyingzhuangia fucanilytica]ANW96835.1 NAD(P)-dependent oxidoreductase [Wenyingzhuangia fucanilytica]
MNNILVTGANGQLGSEIQNLAKDYKTSHFFFTDVSDLDITNIEKVRDFCTTHQIKTIINCAAYTAVDKAEEQTELCNAVNHIATVNLSTVAKELNIKLIHTSTDYVFNGKNHVPFKENDLTDPINVYGKTKLLGEEAMININPKHSIIIRTSWVYSTYGNNFVKTMLKLSETREQLTIIADQVGSPTYAYDLAKTILEIIPKINNDQVEVYHYSNEGVCSWYDFAYEIFHQTNTNCKVLPIETKDYPTAAERPQYSVMNKSKIKNTFDIEIPHWKTSLANCLKKL